ncbi:MAG: hypothetical protein ACXIU8_02105 [Alkalilacustris sp.]
MATVADRSTRAPASVANLTVALQRGGSDGCSAMTASPALGRMSELPVARGGTTILAGRPEIHGTQPLLTGRAVCSGVGGKPLARIRRREGCVARDGGSLDTTPTPGTKRGGLTARSKTSLRAPSKGGDGTVR